MNGAVVIFRNEKYFARFYIKLQTSASSYLYSEQYLFLLFHLCLSP